MDNSFVDNYYVLVLFSKKITFSLKKTNLQKMLLWLPEEKLDGIDIDGIGNLENLPWLVFINKECGDFKVVVDGGEFPRNINKKKSHILQASRCPLCYKCYKRDCFFNKDMEHCNSIM